MSRYARKTLQDLFADHGPGNVTMLLANFHDVDDDNAKFDRAVVSFVDDEKAVSYTGAVILIGEAVKEHCRSAWADGKPLVTLTPSVNGGLPEVTAELPPAGEGVSDGEAAPVGEAAKA